MMVPGGGPEGLPTVSAVDVGEIAAQALLRDDLSGRTRWGGVLNAKDLGGLGYADPRCYYFGALSSFAAYVTGRL